MKKPQKMKDNRKQVIRLFTIVSAFIMLVFIGRFFYIMVGGRANGYDLVQRAEQRTAVNSILPAERGTIYDIGGEPLAMDASSYTLQATLTTEWSEEGAPPIHVPPEKKEETAEKLSKHINMDKEDILDRLNTPGAKQVEFGDAGSNLSYAEMLAIKNEELQGIDFSEQPARTYPNGKFASHLIGYASYSGDEEDGHNRLVGQMGIEKALNETLTGKDGVRLPGGGAGGSDATTQEPVDGQDVYTTIDSRLQSYLETLVDQLEENSDLEDLTAMMVEPSTGKIMAATQRPTFNPQTREGLEDMWQNLLVEKSFEPGSTMKVFTIAAAIEEGIFNPTAKFMSGAIDVDGTVIRDYNKVGWGEITQLEGLAHSSNVLMVELVQEMGYEKWKNYMLEFGLTQSPQSGLANEDNGYMTYDTSVERVNTGFGQGVRVTPWQLMQGFTAIANGGKMMRLHYVDRYQDDKGNIQFQEPEEVSAPISPKTAELTLKYLTSVVSSDEGSGKMFNIEGTQIAAKTGTAQIYDEENGGYLPDDYIHSVVGFAPAENPRFIFYLSTRKMHYRDGLYPHTQMADVFVPFVTRALEYTKLDQQNNQSKHQVPDVSNSNVAEAEQAIAAVDGLQAVTIGSGDSVVDQYPKAGTSVSNGSTVYLITSGPLEMPDFTGLSRSDAENLAQLLGMKATFEGDGNVNGQDIAPGTSLRNNNQVTFQLTQ